MVDFITGFVVGVALSWWFWPCVIMAALFFESIENRFVSVVLTIVGAWAAYNVLGIAAWALPWYIIIAGYTVLGFVHSFWRWFRYTDEKVNEFNKNIDEINEENKNAYRATSLENAKHAYLREVDYTNNLETISYWIIMWPISFIVHMFGDVLTLIRKTVVTCFDSIFSSITDRANKKAKIDLESNDRNDDDEDESTVYNQT